MKTSLFLAGALVGGAAALPSASKLVEADHFKVISAEPRHIHAEFWDLGYRNKQNGMKGAETLFYDVSTGEALFQLTVAENSSTIQYLDHEPITFEGHHGKTTKEAMIQIAASGSAHARVLGRQALHEHPSFANSITRMAIAVGQRGIYGNAHPASYYLYATALKFEQAARGEHGQQLRVEADVPSEDMALLEVATEEKAEQKEEFFSWLFGAAGSVVGITRRRRRRRSFQWGMTSWHGYFNNRNQLHSPLGRCKNGYGYPGKSNRQTCFGVCGPGCECWIFICGRCDRMYQGCTEHDCICIDHCQDMKGNPRNSNSWFAGYNNNKIFFDGWATLGACNMLNTYQDWGTEVWYAQACCQYGTQQAWWNDGDCQQMSYSNGNPKPYLDWAWTATNKQNNKESNRVYIWGIGGHFPGMQIPSVAKKKAKKFNYFLEYNSDFSVPSNWMNNNWWANPTTPVNVLPSSNNNAGTGGVNVYNGQGYSVPNYYSSSGFGINTNSRTSAANHRDWLTNSGVHIADDYIFVKPYGHWFFPASSDLTDLGYDYWHRSTIYTVHDQAVKWPGCGIDGNRVITGYHDRVNTHDSLSSVGSWYELGHHGYVGLTDAGGPYAYPLKNDSAHNLWYYDSGDEGTIAKDRWISGGEGKPNYQLDWDTSFAPNSLAWPNSDLPPKKKYGMGWWRNNFTDTLWNGSFGAVAGDQFDQGMTDGHNGSNTGQGCLWHTYQTFPTPAPTHAPTKSPTHYPTISPTPSPTTYPTAFPTSSPTENPNWGNCCVKSNIGQLLDALSPIWAAQYPPATWNVPVAVGVNPWIHASSPCDTILSQYGMPSGALAPLFGTPTAWSGDIDAIWACNKPKWIGWVVQPGQLPVPGPNVMSNGHVTGGCEWIGMGLPGNWKCPHETNSVLVAPQTGMTPNTYGSGPINTAMGITIPAPSGNGKANDNMFAVAVGNNINPMGITIPNNNDQKVPDTRGGGDSSGGGKPPTTGETMATNNDTRGSEGAGGRGQEDDHNGEDDAAVNGGNEVPINDSDLAEIAKIEAWQATGDLVYQTWAGGKNAETSRKSDNEDKRGERRNWKGDYIFNIVPRVAGKTRRAIARETFNRDTSPR